MANTKGQIQITVNWIYIVLAGAVILLFFVGLVVKGKASAQKQISQDVVQVMGNIFTGAGVSEKTKIRIETIGLSDFTFQFTCEEGTSTFGIKGSESYVEDSTQPTFSPFEIQTKRLHLWSLPYHLPYKVIDFLFVTSANTKYVLIAPEDDQFVTEFKKATSDQDARLVINWEHLTDLGDVDAEGNYQIRVVDLEGSVVKHNAEVPSGLLGLGDAYVTAVSFLANGQIDYFQKDGLIWKKTTQKSIPLISLAQKRDAAKYGAIFAASGGQYQCNMLKAFKRLELVNQIYSGTEIVKGIPGGKLGEMVNFYESHPDLSLSRTDCYGYIGVGNKKYTQNLVDELQQFQSSVSTCIFATVSQDLDSSCVNLDNLAASVRNLNDELQLDCISLY